MTPIYLDYASAAPLRPNVRAAIAAALESAGADPGRLHHSARRAREVLESARNDIADSLGARSSREVILTSSATEAIHHVCHGVRGSGTRTHSVLAAVEHSAVLRAATAAGPTTIIGADRLGAVDVDQFVAALQPDTVLAHIQLANHEVATAQPVNDVIAACHTRDVMVHVDGAAVGGHVDIDFSDLDADFLSISGAKAGGGGGIGCLLIRRGLRLAPLFEGAAQERGRRAGLENIVGAVALASALAAANADFDNDSATREFDLVEQLWGLIEPAVGITRHGDRLNRAPHILCVSVAGIEAEPILIGLDQRGVAAHSGSSCSSEVLEPSPVLAAMGAAADHSLRFSVGWATTPDEIEHAAAEFHTVTNRLRALRAGAGS